jgi:hypothetical protein
MAFRRKPDRRARVKSKLEEDAARGDAGRPLDRVDVEADLAPVLLAPAGDLDVGLESSRP